MPSFALSFSQQVLNRKKASLSCVTEAVGKNKGRWEPHSQTCPFPTPHVKKTTRTRQIVCEVDPTPFDEELKKVKESLSARDWLGGKILGVFNETEKTVHQIFCQKNAGIAVKIVKEKLTL